jgi:hypothetical protein
MVAASPLHVHLCASDPAFEGVIAVSAALKDECAGSWR